MALVHQTKDAAEFESPDEADAAFKASGYDRDNISYRWDGVITGTVSLFGPLGTWLGLLADADA